MAESLIYISFHKLKGNQKTHLSRHLDIQLCNLACHFFAIVKNIGTAIGTAIGTIQITIDIYSNDICIDKHKLLPGLNCKLHFVSFVVKRR